MTRNARRIIFIAFAIFFSATSAAVLLFAAGYRYNFAKRKLEKTGLIRVDSVPHDATILLNGKRTLNRTPARLTWLLPGEYTVRLEREGYLPWEKRLQVQSGAVTFTEEIKLFRSDVPILAIPGEIVNVSLSPNGEFLAYAALRATSTEIRVSEPARERDTRVGELRAGTKEVNFAWSESGELLITAEGAQFLVMPGSERAALDLQKSASGGLARAFWGDDRETLYGFIRTSPGRGTLLRIDPKTGARTAIASPVPERSYMQGETLYAIEGLSAAPKLTSRSVANASTTTILTLPAGTYEFLPSPAPYITLRELRTARIVVVEPQNQNPMRLAIASERGQWQTDGTLLSSNDFEIWLSNPADGSSRLLARYSEGVRDAHLNKEWPYVFGSWAGIIRALDLDTREPRTVYELVKGTEVADFTLSPDGKMLYFAGTIGNAKGIFSLTLR